MQTGYTADIKDGIDFKTYALNCARAFGACVELRDEGGGGEIIPEEFKVSSYHLDRIAEIESEIFELNNLTAEECKISADSEYEEKERRRIKGLEDDHNLEESYRKMLLKVNEWDPPTEDHKELKNFMRTQIEQSIDFDCSKSFYDNKSVRKSGAEWKSEREKDLNEDLKYHQKKYNEEVGRVGKRNKWIKDLCNSLK